MLYWPGVSSMKAFCEFRDSTDHPPVHGLQINSCGQQQAGQYGYTILRSKGRSDYHLLYVQSGWITAEKDGAPVCISSGGFIFYPPDARQLYAFSKEGNAISYWIHFTGTAIEDALADLPYKRTFCGQVDERMQFESLLHQLSQTHHMRGPAYLLDEGGLLLQILASLSRSVNRQESTECSEIRAAAAYLCEHFCQPLSLADCAARLHLSVSRFSHLFTKTIGVSPYQYLLRLRLDRACELLLIRNLISAISRSWSALTIRPTSAACSANALRKRRGHFGQHTARSVRIIPLLHLRFYRKSRHPVFHLQDACFFTFRPQHCLRSRNSRCVIVSAASRSCGR